MPFNQIKRYNQLLELKTLNPIQKKRSLQLIFDRDITNNLSFKFNKKQINPTPIDGEIKMKTLYTHLTTVITDKKTRKREFDNDRAIRLHWIKYHIDTSIRTKNTILIFSVKEPEGKRTYIYNKAEQYVIILEPLRTKNEYYLLTAYHLRGKDAKRNKFEKKYRRRLNEVL